MKVVPQNERQISPMKMRSVSVDYFKKYTLSIVPRRTIFCLMTSVGLRYVDLGLLITKEVVEIMVP